jgi:uncharacterized protein (DUF1697 family)
MSCLPRGPLRKWRSSAGPKRQWPSTSAAFYTIVRPTSALQEILEADPYAVFRLPANAKRVVTFLREPPKCKLALPLEVDGARILAMNGREVFTAYVPSPRGPVFMTLIDKTFGTNVMTRTWDTVKKCAAA